MRRTFSALASVVLAGAGLAVAGSLAAPVPAGAYPVPNISLVGHGFGHGRGMGQYGAYGYATTYGWTYPQILSHYYGGTIESTVSPQDISVRLDELAGRADVTFAIPGGTITVKGTADTATAIRVHDNGNGTYTLFSQTGCTAATSTPFPGTFSGAVTLDPPSVNDTSSSVIRVCDLGSRAYQGSFTVSGGTTVNTLPLDEYVAGVVPSESPASWGATGGEAALQAQAVAARSYALAFVAGGGSICDTDFCQVYGGDADLGPAGGYSTYSDFATYSTDGRVLRCSASACGAPNSVAFAEYSSSTGGYSAGGRFPAVVDAGDATPSNPNHTWTANVPVSAVESAYPQIGTLSAVTVTRRNGLGDLGGRVEAMVVSGSGGSVTVSGAQFSAALGLKSDWFAVTQPVTSPRGGDNGYWIAARDGGVFSFGAAPFLGSEGGHTLNRPVVGLAPTADQSGYWEVASDGGIFSFGDAGFFGSTGSLRLNQPVVGIVPTADGLGYTLVARDGGVFNFGDARFLGSLPGEGVRDTITGLGPTADGGGYLLVSAGGVVYPFGDAPFFGDIPEVVPGYSGYALGIAGHRG